MARVLRRGDFVGPGEELTAAYLEERLPDDWLVICNKELPREASSRELDLLIVGDHALFAVEEKHWPGTIRGNEDGWILPTGESESSPLRKLEDIGKRLRQKLEREIAELPRDLLVRQNLGLFVLLSHPDSDPQINDPRAQRQVLRLQTSEDDLIRFDSDRAGAASIAPLRTRITEVLEQLSDQPELPAKVGPFGVTERVATIGPVRTLRAVHDDGTPRILKLVRREPTLDAERREELERFYRREYEALVRLADSGVVPKADPYFFWDQDQFLVFPLHVPRGRTLRADAVEGSHPRGPAVLELSRHAFDGLRKLHAQGVVHRGLTPDRIVRVEPGGICVTDLHIARVSGEDTVAAQVAESEAESGWRAPECATDPSVGGPKSDVWSLAACLVYWMFGSESDEETRGLREMTASELDLDAEVFSALSGLLEACLAEDPDKRPAPDEAVAALDQITTERTHVPSSRGGGGQHEGFTPGQVVDRRYRIERILGAGATATSYLAVDRVADTQVVLKVIRDRNIAQRLSKPEWRALTQLNHPNLPRMFDINPPEASFHVKLEYIRGSTIRDLGDAFVLNADACRRIGADILGALAELDRHDWIHRDISAGNIIVPDEEEGQAHLIDFGLASAEAGRGTAVGTPRYRAPEIDRGGEWTTLCDLYSLAAVLFELATGRLPYRVEAGGALRKDRPVTLTDEERTQLGDRLLAVLLRAADPDPGRRYQSAAEFDEALRASAVSRVEPEGERLVNPTVDALRLVYRNSRIGNTDNRGLESEFAKSTYVETLLDTALLPSIAAGEHRLVVLSGNPGDGKTAFLQRLRSSLLDSGGRAHDDDEAGWRIDHPRGTVAALYDASESHEGRSADDLLEAVLAPIAGGEPSDHRYTAAIAINDGRLLDFFERKGESEYPWLWDRIRRQLLDQDVSSDEVVVVDLKRRAMVHDRTASLLDGVLTELVASERWEICNGCAARAECPILFNARSLTHTGPDETVRERLASATLAVHLRRERRPTLRDLRSALAFVITHDLGCNDIHEEREGEMSPSGNPNRLYFNSVFNGSGSPDLLLDEWHALDPALTAVPALDRFLYFRRYPEHASKLAEAFLVTEDRAAVPIRAESGEGSDWVRWQKRRYYFEGAEVDEGELPSPAATLPYRYLADYERALRQTAHDEGVIRQLVSGVSSACGVPPDDAAGDLAVRVNDAESTEVVVFKRFPSNEFRLERAQSGGNFVESFEDVLHLAHASGTPTLSVTLDLFEYLMRAADGYGVGAEEQRGFLEDITHFVDDLLARPASRVALLDAGRRSHEVAESGGVIRRVEGVA